MAQEAIPHNETLPWDGTDGYGPCPYCEAQWQEEHGHLHDSDRVTAMVMHHDPMCPVVAPEGL